MKCEVADTPTGVVMNGCQGIRMERDLICENSRRKRIHGQKQEDTSPFKSV